MTKQVFREYLTLQTDKTIKLSHSEKDKDMLNYILRKFYELLHR